MFVAAIKCIGLLALVSSIGFLARLAFRTYAYGADEASHDASQFDGVLAGRYAFMAFVLACVAFTGIPWLVLLVLASIAALGFWDAHVYSLAGLDGAPHLQAGILGVIALVFVALYFATTVSSEV